LDGNYHEVQVVLNPLQKNIALWLVISLVFVFLYPSLQPTPNGSGEHRVQ